MKKKQKNNNNNNNNTVEPGDSPRIDFYHRQVVCQLSVHQIQHKDKGPSSVKFKSETFILLKLRSGQNQFEK